MMGTMILNSDVNLPGGVCLSMPVQAFYPGIQEILPIHLCLCPPPINNMEDVVRRGKERKKLCRHYTKFA